MKIGIIKEGKVPVDHRVPFTPEQCKRIMELVPDAEVVVQPSDIRCFSDEDYLSAGITLQQDLSDCDILFGVKEVPIPELLHNKQYFFFSHTIKKQPYNRGLLQEILKKNIALSDYECLTDKNDKRVVAFGRFAGIVGAYNGVLTYGQRFKLFDLKPAHDCFDMNELWGEFKKVKLPAIKIVLTGGGRVAQGSQEVLDGLGIKKVSAGAFLNESFDEAVYTQLDSDAYNARKDGGKFDFKEFYSTPELYEGRFLPYAHQADILIAGAYWDPDAPVLFTKEDMKRDDFNIKVIADITCDIEGSVPSTLRATTIADPLFDYDPQSGKEKPALSNDDYVTVMSVDNLPCELPRDASESFGAMLLEHVVNDLADQKEGGIVHGATITKNGQLTQKFDYLSDYIAE